MTGVDVRRARKAKQWRQHDLARRLGVSQAYVSLLESDQRKVPAHVQPKLVALLDLPANHLPLGRNVDPWPPDRVASALGSLGYAGFAHMASRRKVNPTELVARTLTREHVEARLVEALPWLLVRYPNLDWEWLVGHAKQHDVQNRLGFVVTVARELAERSHDEETAATLRTWEAILERSRLQKEDSFAGAALSDAERRWLQTNRSAEASQWNMLSNISVDTLTNA